MLIIQCIASFSFRRKFREYFDLHSWGLCATEINTKASDMFFLQIYLYLRLATSVWKSLTLKFKFCTDLILRNFFERAHSFWDSMQEMVPFFLLVWLMQTSRWYLLCHYRLLIGNYKQRHVSLPSQEQMTKVERSPSYLMAMT